jgi:PAS domain S-box-containing protein
MTEKLRGNGAGAEWPAIDPRDLGLDILGMDGLVVVDSDHRLLYASPAACKLLGCTLDSLLKRDFPMSIPEQEARSTPERLAAGPGGESVRWTAVLPRPDGSELDVECTATRLEVGGEQLIGVRLQDVSERRRQAREANALAQEAARIATSDGIETTLQALAEGALSGTRALGAAVWIDSEEERAIWIGTAGLPDRFPEDLRGAATALSRLAGDQIPAAYPRVVADPDARQRLETDPAWTGLTEGLKPLPWQAAVFAPLIYRRANVGMLMALYPTGKLPSAEEAVFLTTLSDHAAVATVNVRLVAAAQDSPCLEERRRLAARELHDSVSQALYGIALGAKTARDLLERDPARLSQPIDYILQLAAVGLAEMRASIFDVRPESLETEGLVTALNRQIEALRTRNGIAAQPVVCAEPASPPVVKRVLYRIAQGALRNVVKHAHAGRVDVRLEAPRGKVVLEVEDDGIGFEPGPTLSENPGLRSELERARGIGGSLEVVSAPGRGTRIRVSVPLRPEEPGD